MTGHVLVVIDESPPAVDLRGVVASARETGAAVTVVAFAPVERPSRCCNIQTTFWNAEMRRLARGALAGVREVLGGEGQTEFVVREDRGRGAVEAAAANLGAERIVDARRRGRGRLGRLRSRGT